MIHIDHLIAKNTKLQAKNIVLQFSYMKKIYWILIIIAILFASLGLYLGWLDNGPEFF
jgi:hypothetical protein